jgi:hypothetical protein
MDLRCWKTLPDNDCWRMRKLAITPSKPRILTPCMWRYFHLWGVQTPNSKRHDTDTTVRLGMQGQRSGSESHRQERRGHNKWSNGRIPFGPWSRLVLTGTFTTCRGQQPRFRSEHNRKECIHVYMRYFRATCEVNRGPLVNIPAAFFRRTQCTAAFHLLAGGRGQNASTNSAGTRWRLGVKKGQRRRRRGGQLNNQDIPSRWLFCDDVRL